MIPILFFFEKFRKMLKRNFIKVLISLAIVIMYGTFSEYYIEKGIPGTGITNLFNSLWFVVQTITTVGYGDTPVVGFWGRVNAMVLMLIGISILGLFTASLASLLMEYSLSKIAGNHKIMRKDHIIICNWNPLAEDIVKELYREYPYIVLLAPLEENPMKELDFVKGTCLHIEDLEKVNIRKAKTAIILSEAVVDGELASAYDAKVILGVMNIRKLSQSTYIIAELLKNDSTENAITAGVDEVVVKGRISSKLILKGSLYPGTIEVIDHVVTAKTGEEILEWPVPKWAIGKKYGEVAKELINKNITLIGVKSKEGIKISPPYDYKIEEGKLIYITRKENLKNL